MKIRGLHHITLVASNAQRTVDFYVKVLGLPLVKQLCNRLRVPNKYRELALVVCEYHLHMHRLDELKPKTILKLLESTGSLKNQERAEQFAMACEADSRGRTGLENRPYPQRQHFLDILAAANSINSAEIAETASKTGHSKDIKTAIARARQQAIAKHIKSH